MRKLCLILSLLFLCSLSVFADEELTTDTPIQNIESEVIEDVPTDTQNNSTVEYTAVIDSPVEVIAVKPEDYETALRSVSGSIYNGSFNTTAYNYFQSVLMKNVSSDYVAFRSSQYVYDLFYGDGLKYENGRFSGSSLNHCSYNSQSQYNIVTYDTDDLNISVGNGFCYSNLGDMYGSFTEVQTAKILYLSGILLIVLLAFSFIKWIFVR